MGVDWGRHLADQLDWHWHNQLRPRLTGLSDEEYRWEPVPGCWGVRPGAGGRYELQDQWPPPDPAPVTTIAWRLAHIIVGVFGDRNEAYFGGPPMADFGYAGTADEALAQLDAGYAIWHGGVCDLGTDGLAKPCGPASGPYAEYPLGALVLHINREAIHHGAEIALLRDLYLRQS